MPLKRPIKTLFLDAGGVLVFPNWQRVSETLARHGVIADAEALRAAEPRAKFAIDDAYRVATTKDADRGSRYFQLTFDIAGIPVTPAVENAIGELYAYHGEHNLWEHVPENVIPALERLAASNLTLAVASNANGVLHKAFDRLGLTPHFRCICDSWVEGVEKPDPRFFEIVLERSGGEPDTTLHVGDLYHVDVEGARRAGLQTLLLDPHDLYRGFDVDRIKTLDELVSMLA